MTLQDAITHDDVGELYSSIESNEMLLDNGCTGPFPHTPLHQAALEGKTNVAMEIAMLKPSFARKLNKGGHSPMHLALQNKRYDTARALMTLNPKLIRVRGRGGITPLHLIAGEEGNNEQESKEPLELLAEFLSACKSSIEDLTSQYQTAVHVAVDKNNLKAFKVLLGWLKRVHLTEILKWKDKYGNTVLHIAMSQGRPKIIKLLIPYINVNTKNFHDETALEIFRRNPSGDLRLAIRLYWERCLTILFTSNLSLSQFLSMELTRHEKLVLETGLGDKSTRDMVLIVTTLIATATYQAVLSPPGGYWQDNSSNTPANSTVVAAKSSGIAVEKPHKAGEIILNGSNLHKFTGLNSSVFVLSILVICYTAAPLLPRTIPVYSLTLYFGVAYIVALTTEFPRSDARAGYCIMAVFMSSLVYYLAAPLVDYFWYGRIRRGIDTPGRRVCKDRK